MLNDFVRAFSQLDMTLLPSQSLANATHFMIWAIVSARVATTTNLPLCSRLCCCCGNQVGDRKQSKQTLIFCGKGRLCNTILT